jgi:ankyrin repeat protein/serine/threonine protein kinase
MDELERELELFFPALSLNEPDKKTNQNASTAASSTGRRKFDDAEIQRLSELLAAVGKQAWSLRPRTYAVLRMINRVDAMGAFVIEGLFDISLPYSDKTLPVDALGGSVAVRAKFLELQSLVLSAPGAVDLEAGSGSSSSHAHFDRQDGVQFQSLRVLGQGGFGKVDHVRSRLSMNEFARKQIPRGRTFKRDRVAIADFERELATLKRLSHRHLVKFVGSYTDPKNIGIIMSPVADSNLAEYLEVCPLPEDRRGPLRSFYGCLSSALLYLHEKHIRHKDIKPSNTLVHGDNVLLTDFGTALDWSDKGKSTTMNRPSALSLAYCSPEVAAWEARNSSSDIWSLGCVFFEMTSVLVGLPLDEMRDFYTKNGSSGSYIRTNSDATLLWSERIRKTKSPKCDVEPLKWVAEMVSRTPRERPSAQQLVGKIQKFRGEYPLCGACCAGDTEDSDWSDYEVLEGVTGEDVADITNLSIEIPTRGLAMDEAEYQKAAQLLLERDVDVEEEDFDGLSAFAWAIFEEQEAVVRLLVMKGVSVDARLFWRRPALHEAARTKREAVVRILLSVGADFTKLDGDGLTALYWASYSGSEAIVIMLIEAGDDVEGNLLEEKVGGLIPIQWAALHGYHDLIRLLAKKGADLDAKTKFGSTALHLASESSSSEETARLLIDLGSNLKARTEDGETVLHSAVSREDEALARLFIQDGVSVHAKTKYRRTALHDAAKNGSLAIVQMLIDAGAKVDVSDWLRETPSMMASTNGHDEVLQLLLEQSSKAEGLGEALRVACRNGRVSIVEMMLEKGADIEGETKAGGTPIMNAAFKGHESVVRFLIEKGANVNPTPVQGRTPLHWAVEEDHEPVARLLVENGADVEAKRGDDGLKALQLAVKASNYDMELLLIQNGADVIALSTAEFDDAVRWAAMYGKDDLLQLLLEKGPGLKSLEDGGERALGWAINENSFQAADLLRQHGAQAKRLYLRHSDFAKLVREEGFPDLAQLIERTPCG